MSKFDNIRKDIKRKKTKTHFVYIIIFLIMSSFSFSYNLTAYDKSKKEYENVINTYNIETNKLEKIIIDYQIESKKLGENLIDALNEKEEYKKFFETLPFGNPLDVMELTSTFGWRRHPIYKNYRFHSGIDLSAKVNTTVYASGSGKIIYSGTKRGYGKIIIIKHKFNNRSLYSHLNKSLVVLGQEVKKGEKIALSGNTGVSTGPHLHFEIQINKKAVNPFEYLTIGDSLRMN